MLKWIYVLNDAHFQNVDISHVFRCKWVLAVHRTREPRCTTDLRSQNSEYRRPVAHAIQ